MFRLVLSSVGVRIVQLYYTVYCSILLIVGFIFKGYKLFEKKNHEKPECLEGWNSRYIKLKKIRLHYVQTGEDDKPLLLFIHGYPEFWYSWRFQLKEFANDYRCVAIDQRGYNLSDKPKLAENYKMVDLVDDIRDVIDTLGYKKAVVAAHDWGGAVAWQFAEWYPEMVDKLIVFNIPRPTVLLRNIGSNWTQFRKSWYIFFYQSSMIPEMMNSCDDMKMLEMCFRSKGHGIVNKKNFTNEDLEAWKYTFSNNGASFKFPINFYRNLFDKQYLRSEKDDVVLNMPILIVWGTADGALEKHMAVESKKSCSNCRLEWIDGASHWVQQDKPERANQLMTEFLAC